MSREIENIERLMKNKEVEFRDFRITNVEVRSGDDGQEEMIVEGIPCVFEQETVLYKGKYWEDREVIDKNAFASCDMTDVIFNFNHGGRVYARTRNGSLGLQVTDNALKMSAKLMNGDEGHAQLYRDIKSGLLDKMSFAFHTKSCEYTTVENSDGPNVEIRRVTEIDKLYDVSVVDIPAYDTTSISARNIFEAERERRKAESEKREKKLAKLNLKIKLEKI